MARGSLGWQGDGVIGCCSGQVLPLKALVSSQAAWYHNLFYKTGRCLNVAKHRLLDLKLQNAHFQVTGLWDLPRSGIIQRQGPLVAKTV